MFIFLLSVYNIFLYSVLDSDKTQLLKIWIALYPWDKSSSSG